MTELVRRRERDVVVVLHRPSPDDSAYLPGSPRTRFLIMFGAQLAGTGLASLLGGLVPMPWSPFLAGLAAAAPLLVFWKAVPWLRRRRIQSVREWDGVGNPPAPVVRLVGVVEAEGQPFRAPCSGVLVVYARTHYVNVNLTGTVVEEAREELRGVPFRISPASGQAVLLTPSQVWLLDPDTKIRKLSEADCEREGVRTAGKGRKYQQTVLRVGDEVELVGRLDREVSPTGTAAPGRGVPTELVVLPAWKGGVWVRRLPRNTAREALAAPDSAPVDSGT